MAGQKKQAAEGLKFWAVTGYQKQDMEVVRYVRAASAEEAVGEATFGEVIREDAPRGVDWDEWGANNLPEEDAEEVSEAEAKGTEEQDAPNLPGLCPLWETIAPTMEEGDPEEPGYLIGDIEILGVKFHVEAVKVKIGNAGPMAANMAHEEKLEAMLGLDLDGATPQTVKIPGHLGRWVLTISPYTD